MAVAEVVVATAAAEAAVVATAAAEVAAVVIAKIINRSLIPNFRNPFHLVGKDFFYHEFTDDTNYTIKTN
jgi:hypothetical protein